MYWLQRRFSWTINVACLSMRILFCILRLFRFKEMWGTGGAAHEEASEGFDGESMVASVGRPTLNLYRVLEDV